METFADQAVIAIENVRLFEEVQARTRDLSEALEQQTATADVLKAISLFDFQSAFGLQTLVQSAARLCEADIGTISREIGREDVCSEFYGLPQALPELIEQYRSNRIADRPGRALLEGKVDSDRRCVGTRRRHFSRRLGGSRAVSAIVHLGVPMLREGNFRSAC